MYLKLCFRSYFHVLLKYIDPFKKSEVTLNLVYRKVHAYDKCEKHLLFKFVNAVNAMLLLFDVPNFKRRKYYLKVFDFFYKF